MPWAPHFTRAQAEAAIAGAGCWKNVLDALGYEYHGKNIATVRKWAERWAIDVGHLSDQRASARRGRPPRYSDAALRAAVAASRSWAETLRRLGYCPSGGNWKTVKSRTAKLGIVADHFDPYANVRGTRPNRRIPLEDILIEGSTYSRGNLKRRLYETGIKERRCELCGQHELWRGRRMALILDHANGVRDDNRLENIRIVCPNCAATLETHCGRNGRETVDPRPCVRCSKEFIPNCRGQRYCSRECGSRWDRRGVKRPGARKAERPSQERLLGEVEALGYLAVGRKYGVSDNAIRKWLREYEQERLMAAGGSAEEATIPVRTWPNRNREAEPTKEDHARPPRHRGP